MKGLILCFLLSGCGVTADQRMWDTMSSMNTPEFNKAFEEAKLR